MNKMNVSIILVTLAFAQAGCATSFRGSPHIAGGRRGCEAKCQGQGMQTAGIVYIGEYSSACVCEVVRASASRDRGALVGAVSGAAGASAGVFLQMQAAQQQQR